MNKFAILSLFVASAMATDKPKDYFCSVTVATYKDEAACKADGDGTKGKTDEKAAAALTAAAQAGKTDAKVEGDFAYKVTKCTKDDGVTLEYYKKDATDKALDGDDLKAAVKAVTTISETKFGECTKAGTKFAFVDEATAKYNDFSAHNLCRVDSIKIYSDKACKTEITDKAKGKTALEAAQAYFDKAVLYAHTKEACKDDKIASCADDKITVTAYEAAAAKDGKKEEVKACTVAKKDPAPVVYDFTKCRDVDKNAAGLSSDVKSYQFKHDTSLDKAASFLKAGAAAILAFTATQF